MVTLFTEEYASDGVWLYMRSGYYDTKEEAEDAAMRFAHLGISRDYKIIDGKSEYSVY
jgi:hypothetical protein